MKNVKFIALLLTLDFIQVHKILKNKYQSIRRNRERKKINKLTKSENELSLQTS